MRAFTADVRIFRDRRDVTIPYLFYAVPDTARGIPTVVYPTWWDNMHGEHWDPDLGVVYETIKPYFGPIPGPNAVPLEGADALVNGYLYSEYVAGKYPAGFCWPVLPGPKPSRIRQRQRILTGRLHATQAGLQAQRVIGGPLTPGVVRQASGVAAVPAGVARVREAQGVAGVPSSSFPGSARQVQRLTGSQVSSLAVRQASMVAGALVPQHYENGTAPPVPFGAQPIQAGLYPAVANSFVVAPGAYATWHVYMVGSAVGNPPALVSWRVGSAPFTGPSSGLLPVVSATLVGTWFGSTYWDVVLPIAFTAPTTGTYWLTMDDSQDAVALSCEWTDAVGGVPGLAYPSTPTPGEYLTVDP